MAEAWKIGRKGKDNGAILVIVPDDREMRLEIGYGWEGEINDAKAGDVIRDMAPFFRAGIMPTARFTRSARCRSS